MPAFGSARWPDNFGPVARLNSTVTAISLGAVGASPVTGSTEGTDLLTYRVLAEESGLYMLYACIHTDVASDAGTSQTLEINVTYNDGAAVTAASLGELNTGQPTGNTNVPIDATTINTRIQQMGIVRAEAGTDITLATIAVNGGTVATVGSFDVDFCIIRVA